MNQGAQTIIYPVKDLARARAQFSRLLAGDQGRRPGPADRLGEGRRWQLHRAAPGPAQIAGPDGQRERSQPLSLARS